MLNYRTVVKMEEQKLRLTQLDSRKHEIEDQIAVQKAVLDANCVGMNEPLVDREGFPRSDIDVYKVRHARHNIICLMNDHKAIMREIEDGLHRFHGSMAQKTGGYGMSSTKVSVEDCSTKPFAVVMDVEEGSPAQLAGLRANDTIVRFGSVNSDNFKSVGDIGAVVRHSVGKPVNVSVKRRDDVVSLVMTPKQWSGKGFLGCKINAL